MKTAAVSKLKAGLSEYLARVKAGEEVIVTERGKPIAKIVPFGGNRRRFRLTSSRRPAPDSFGSAPGSSPRDSGRCLARQSPAGLG